MSRRVVFRNGSTRRDTECDGWTGMVVAKYGDLFLFFVFSCPAHTDTLYLITLPSEGERTLAERYGQAAAPSLYW